MGDFITTLMDQAKQKEFLGQNWSEKFDLWFEGKLAVKCSGQNLNKENSSQIGEKNCVKEFLGENLDFFFGIDNHFVWCGAFKMCVDYFSISRILR